MTKRKVGTPPKRAEFVGSRHECKICGTEWFTHRLKHQPELSYRRCSRCASREWAHQCELAEKARQHRMFMEHARKRMLN
jgi:ribosomal protein S14